MFDDSELAFLRSQRLARIATVDGTGQPDNSPVGFEFDGRHFWVGGHNLPATRKYKNVAGGHTKVALVIDDLASVDPWRPRGVRVFGVAEIEQRDGHLGAGEYLKITPTTSWSWALGRSGEGGGARAFRPKRTAWT